MTTTLSWESQSTQYAPTGKPGIHLEQHTVGNTVIDCLLFRNEDGELVGILNHYNENNHWQKPGSCNLWVHPDHQRQGIASALLRDAWHRWQLSYEHQNWSEEGNAWIGGLVERGKADLSESKPLNEEGWKEHHVRIESYVDHWWVEKE